MEPHRGSGLGPRRGRAREHFEGTEWGEKSYIILRFKLEKTRKLLDWKRKKKKKKPKVIEFTLKFQDLEEWKLSLQTIFQLQGEKKT